MKFSLKKTLALFSASAGIVRAEYGYIRGEIEEVPQLRGLKGPDGIPCKKVFNFNMIAHNDPKQPSCDNNGNRIFIQKKGSSQIAVYQDGTTYDIGCVEGKGDKYTLSVPDFGTFDVYTRILGKPGGTLDIEVCELADPDNCFIDTFSLERKVGGGGGNKSPPKSSFSVSTNDLFSDDYEEILWKTTTNKDFKIAQFWFCNRD